MAPRSYPAEVRHLPAPILAALWQQCHGDWSRVTVDGRGSITVHNHPRPDGLGKVKAPRAPRSTVKPPRARKAAGPSPAPPPVRRPEPPLKNAPVRPPVQPIPMPVFTPPAPPVVAAPKERRPEPEPAPTRKLRPASEVLRQEPTPLVAPESEATWVLMPGVAQPKDWDGSDFAEKAWRLGNRVRRGVGDRCPLMFHDDVTALNGVDLEQVESVARHAERVEVDASSAWKRYPILRFYRGDNLVVVGFQDPIAPMIIAAYFRNLDGSGSGGQQARTGGGGARKTGGLPNTPEKLLKALRGLGAQVSDPEPSETVVEVTYEGTSLGKVTVDPHASRREIESAYQRTLRRIQAIKLRAASGKTG